MKRHYRKLFVVILTLCMVITASGGAFAESRVTFGNSRTTVDSFNGVPAYYKIGNHNEDNDYSCAGYVDRYYKTVYGVDPHNLRTGCTPQTYTKGYSFKQINASQVLPGDIGYQTNSKGSGHWFIIKYVNGKNLTIIEQNWKSGNTAPVDRVVTFGKTPNLKVFRLYKDGVDMNREGTLANLLFDYDLYYNLYPDLQNIGYNPEALRNHYNTHGIAEGRIASVYLDPKYYMECQTDVAKTYGANNYRGAYEHFLKHGFYEGRQGSPVYSSAEYLAKYKDLRDAFGSDYYQAAVHFRDFGIKEQRQSCNEYSVSAYAAKNSDLRKVFTDPKQFIQHYLQFGQYENRKCV